MGGLLSFQLTVNLVCVIELASEFLNLLFVLLLELLLLPLGSLLNALYLLCDVRFCSRHFPFLSLQVRAHPAKFVRETVLILVLLLLLLWQPQLGCWKCLWEREPERRRGASKYRRKWRGSHHLWHPSHLSDVGVHACDGQDGRKRSRRGINCSCCRIYWLRDEVSTNVGCPRWCGACRSRNQQRRVQGRDGPCGWSSSQCRPRGGR